MVDMSKWEGGKQLTPEEEGKYLKDLCAYLRKQQTLSEPTKNEDGVMTCEIVDDEVAAHVADIIEELWGRLEEQYREGVVKGMEIKEDEIVYEMSKGKSMNRDDIIRMAKDAGLVLGYSFTWENLERFAALVAAAERKACMRDQEGLVEFNSLLAKHHTALVEQQKPGPWPAKEVIDKAVAAEREACARDAERFLLMSSGAVWEPKHFCEGIATAIRARDGAELPTKLVDFEYDGSYRHPSEG